MRIQPVLPIVSCLLACTVSLGGCITEENFLTPTGSIEKILSFDAGNKVVFSPDGKYIVAMKEWFLGQSEHANARMYDVGTGKLVRTFRLDEDSDIFGVAFSPDGTLLATCGGESVERISRNPNKTVAVFDVATGERRYYLKTYREDMHAITFSPDGRLVVFVSGDAVRFWDYRAFRTPDSIPLYYPDMELGIEYSHDGSQILLSPLALVDVNERKEYDLNLGALDGTWQSVAFNADGGQIFGCGEKTLMTIDAKSLRITGRIDERRDEDDSRSVDGLQYRCIDADPTGRYIATGDSFKRLKLWSATNGELIAVADGEETPHCVAFAPDGRTIAVGDDRYHVTIWRIND